MAITFKAFGDDGRRREVAWIGMILGAASALCGVDDGLHVGGMDGGTSEHRIASSTDGEHTARCAQADDHGSR